MIHFPFKIKETAIEGVVISDNVSKHLRGAYKSFKAPETCIDKVVIKKIDRRSYHALRGQKGLFVKTGHKIMTGVVICICNGLYLKVEERKQSRSMSAKKVINDRPLLVIPQGDAKWEMINDGKDRTTKSKKYNCKFVLRFYQKMPLFIVVTTTIINTGQLWAKYGERAS